MKPTPLRRLNPSRRLMREYSRMTLLSDWLRAVAGWAFVIAIGGLMALGITGN